jgi:hypothetical protein
LDCTVTVNGAFKQIVGGAAALNVGELIVTTRLSTELHPFAVTVNETLYDPVAVYEIVPGIANVEDCVFPKFQAYVAPLGPATPLAKEGVNGGKQADKFAGFEAITAVGVANTETVP